MCGWSCGGDAPMHSNSLTAECAARLADRAQGVAWQPGGWGKRSAARSSPRNILSLSISAVRKSRAKPARHSVMLHMRISRLKLSSRCHRTAAGTQAQTGRRALEQHLAAKAHEPGGPPARRGADPAGLFDQALLLDKPPKILLVQ